MEIKFRRGEENLNVLLERFLPLWLYFDDLCM